jgi:hypothetical protein
VTDDLEEHIRLVRRQASDHLSWDFALSRLFSPGKTTTFDSVSPVAGADMSVEDVALMRP